MDPNETLRNLEDSIAVAKEATNEHDRRVALADAVAAFDALNRHLREGGPRPKAWTR